MSFFLRACVPLYCGGGTPRKRGKKPTCRAKSSDPHARLPEGRRGDEETPEGATGRWHSKVSCVSGGLISGKNL